MNINDLIEQFHLDVMHVEDVPESFSSTVYKCKLVNGETVYIKVPYSKLKFDREWDAYEILNGQVAVPTLLDVVEGSEDVPGAFLLSELPGHPLKASTSRKLAYRIGEYHATLHQIQPDKTVHYRAIQNEFEGWSDFVSKQFYSFAEDTQKHIDAKTLNHSLQQFERMQAALPSSEGPSFLHMDFRPANIIVNGDDVVGCLDFESVRFGSTEVDFAKLHRDYLSIDENVFAAYKDGYQSVRPLIDLDVVLPFYRFTDAFNSIGWCERRGVEKNRDFYEKNLALLQEFLR